MGTLVGMPMPQPGETITEGVVVRWIKKIGDEVGEKEPVVELETAKAVYEYESPIGGKLIKIITKEGEQQQVGRPLAVLECDDKQAKKYFMLGVGVPVVASGAVIGSTEAKIGAGAGFGGEHVSTPPRHAAGLTPHGGGIHPPLIRTLAKEHGIADSELGSIPTSGPGGRLTKEDVLRHVAARTSLPPVTAGGRRVEPNVLRRRIAENMVLSKRTIPHAGSAVEVDVTELIALREKNKDAFQKKHGVPLRLAPFFLLAVREGLKKYPVCNNFYFIDDTGKHWIEEHDRINLGVAVGTPKGLVVPVIKDVGAKDFAAIAKESDALMQKAVSGKLSPDDMTGATVTVNNPGALGSIRGNQVISYPQSVIVGFHAIVERACFVDGKCVPRKLMEIDLSFDHRLIDGVEAVGLISVCKKVLETPQDHFRTS